MPEISLRQAFLFALGYFEIWADVSPAERLGLLFEQSDEFDPPQGRVEATGPELVRAIPRPSQGPTRRSEPRSAPKPYVPSVPRVPSYRELSAMDQDHAARPSGQSAAEKRALAVANWITEALATEALIATGAWQFAPQDGSKNLATDGCAQIDAAAYRSWRINFSDSCIEDCENLYWIPGYPENFSGKIWFNNVTVPRGPLLELLRSTKGRRILPEFKFDPTPAQISSRCIINFGGEESKIGLSGRESLHRALMAMALLVRWPNQGISPQILSFLTRRNIDTSKKGKEELKNSAETSQKLQEIAIALFSENIDLRTAHHELALVLSASEGEDVYIWIPHATPREGVPKRNPKKSYSNRRDYSVQTIKKALSEIIRFGGRNTAGFLTEKLIFGQHAFTFRPNKTAVDEV